MNLNQTTSSFVSYVSWGIGIRPCQHQWRPSQKGHPGHQKYQKDSVGVATNCRIPMVSVPCDVVRHGLSHLERRKPTRPVRKTEENSTGLTYLVLSLISGTCKSTSNGFQVQGSCGACPFKYSMPLGGFQVLTYNDISMFSQSWCDLN
jgi:hypothetical protein